MFLGEEDSMKFSPPEAIAWPNIHSYPDLKTLRKKLSAPDRQKYMDLRPQLGTECTDGFPESESRV